MYFSVLNLGKSAVTRLYLVDDGVDIGDTEVACDYSFFDVTKPGSQDTTVKFLNDGMIFFLSIISTDHYRG